MQDVIGAAVFWGKVIVVFAAVWAVGWLLGFLFSFFIASECRKAATAKERARSASRYGFAVGKVVLVLSVISVFVTGKKLPIEEL